MFMPFLLLMRALVCLLVCVDIFTLSVDQESERGTCVLKCSISASHSLLLLCRVYRTVVAVVGQQVLPAGSSLASSKEPTHS